MNTVGEAPPLRFSPEDSDAAHELWGANCGPHAFAAAVNFTLEESLRFLPDFPHRHWTDPGMLARALRGAKVAFYLKQNLRTKDLCGGISKVQWVGEWLNPR